MSTITKYANVHTAITGGYTDPSNAYSDDGSYATAAPGKNSERSAYFGFPAFTTSDIPDGATINSVKVDLEFKVSTTSSVATQYLQIFIGTTGIGSEQVNSGEPMTDTILEHLVTSGILLSDLRTADNVRGRLRSVQGNSSTAVTISIDFVRITVDYTAAQNLTKDLADSVTLSDSPTKEIGYYRTLTDSVTLSDSETAVLIIERSLSDFVSLSDGNTKDAGKNLSDAVTLSDTRQSEASFERSLSDAVTLSDSDSREVIIEKSLSDTVTLSENIEKSTGKNLTDSVSLSDSPARVAAYDRTFTDSVSLSDELSTEKQIFHEITDSVTLSESFSAGVLIERVITDEITVSDSSDISWSNSLVARISALATRIGTEIKSIWTVLAGKSDTSHLHDDRYYTETETDTLLTGKSDTSHLHDDRYYTETEVNTLLSGKSDTTHDHDGTYQPIDADLTAIAGLAGTSGLLRKTAADTWELDLNAYLTAITKAMVEAVLTGTITSHNHNGAYESFITKATGYLRWTGSAWEFKNEVYALSTHNHDGIYEPAITKTSGYAKWTGSVWQFVNETYSLSSHNHDGSYQPLDADLTAIAALGFTATAFLKKTAANTWELDTTVYLTGNQTITLSGDVSGSGATSISVTVNSIKNKAIPTLATGYLRYSGTAWEFLNETYLTAITKTMVEAVLTGTITSHNHSGTYEPLITKATGYLRYTGTVWEFKNETYSLSSHNHSGVYEPVITKSTGYLRWTGTVWEFKNESYSLSTHDHSGVYEPVITKSSGYAKWNGSAWTFVNETYSLSTHDHSGVYEPAFTKNTAFNKNFGTTAGTVCEGDDSRLSDTRTPTDATVSYAKVASDLVGRTTDNDGAWDFGANGIIDAAFSSGATSVSFSNLKQNKVLKVKLVITNAATFTLPAYCTLLDGSVAASGTNGTYYLYFDCWEDASGSEQVLVSITKAAT